MKQRKNQGEEEEFSRYRKRLRGFLCYKKPTQAGNADVAVGQTAKKKKHNKADKPVHISKVMKCEKDPMKADKGDYKLADQTAYQ